MPIGASASASASVSVSRVDDDEVVRDTVGHGGQTVNLISSQVELRATVSLDVSLWPLFKSSQEISCSCGCLILNSSHIDNNYKIFEYY